MESVPMDCDNFPMAPPRIVAIATDKNIVPAYEFEDKDLPGPAPK
jgi:hypothetical protein